MQALQTDVNQRHWTSWLVASIRGHLGNPLNTKQSRTSIKKIENGNTCKMQKNETLKCTYLTCMHLYVYREWWGIHKFDQQPKPCHLNEHALTSLKVKILHL